MSTVSLLDTPALREIDDHLSAGKLEQAQTLLATVDVSSNELAASYLATRLLYLRDRLDPERVILRLREVLVDSPDFAEAQDLLRVAEAGVPGSRSLSAMLAVRPAAEASAPESNPPMAHHRTEPAPSEDGAASVRSFVSGWPSDDPPTAAASDGDRPSPIPSEPAVSSTQSAQWIEVDTRPSTPPVGRSDAPPRLSHPNPRPEGRYAFSGPAGRLGPQDPPRPSEEPGTTSVPPEELQTPAISRAPALPSLTGPGALGHDASPPKRQLRKPVRSISPPRRSLTPGAGRYALRASDRAGPRGDEEERSAAPKFRVPRPGTLLSSSHPVPKPEQSRQAWPDIEVSLFTGQMERVREYLKSAAQQALGESQGSGTDFSLTADRAARFLTQSWISHHFAPFDLSLHSLGRLELFVDAIYGLEGRSGLPLEGDPILRLVGSYIGETIRISHAGEWEDTAGDLEAVRMRAGVHSWHPFRLLHRRVLSGGNPSLRASLQPGMASRGTQAWLSRRESTAPLPELWKALPAADHMPVLGAGLCHSVVGLSCQQRFGVPLDRSLSSLQALNDVVDLLLRSAMPLRGDEPWLQRLCIVVGAYVGEVIRLQVGGHWRMKSAGPLLERFYLELSGGRKATPAGTVAGRAIANDGAQLEGYARAIIRQVG